MDRCEGTVSYVRLRQGVSRVREKGLGNMGLQKLSASVNKKANASIVRSLIGVCILTGFAILSVVFSYTLKDNEKQVKLYSSQVDAQMSEKIGFINTVAAGATSGVAESDYYAYVDTMVAQHDDVSAVYVCVKEDGVVYSDGVMTYMSGGWVPDEDFVVSERGWYIGAMEKDGVYVSEPYVDVQSGNMCITLAKAIYSDGKAVGVAGLDMYMDDLLKLIESSYSGGNYVFLTSGEGTILTHPDDKIALQGDSSTTVKDALGGKYEKVCEKQLKNKLIFDYSGGLKFAISNTSESTGWQVVAVISISWIFVLILVIVLVTVGLGFGIGKIVKKKLLRDLNPMFAPLEELASNVSRISEGELSYTFQVDEQSQEVNALSNALNDTMRGLQHYILEITNTVTAISEKNLNFSVDGEYTGDYEKIKSALLAIMDVLNTSFRDIHQQATTVLSYSENLSDTSESVARSATSQSESVLNASEEMKHLTDNMEKIEQFAANIKQNIDNTNMSLNTGNKEMNELIGAMNEIASCYDEIAEFVTEINAIASQTNLLALNASIEAARAGEAGKGFAVVADEIGTLSGSSTEASEKINKAISRSLQSVEKGKELVLKTGNTISESVNYSVENTQMVDEIVRFVGTQKTSADEISESLRNISEMVESNASSAQENSAISSHLGECAQALMDTIAEFRLKND